MLALSSPLIDAAVALRPLLRREAATIESSRRLTPDVFNAIFAMSGFALQLTEQYGGPAADPMVHLRVIEELSRGDASSGWCAMVGSESSACINAFLQPSAIQEMLQNEKRAVAALTAVGAGQASECHDGYKVTGRWRFASGCRHATWLGGFCTIHDNDGPRLRENGAPLVRLIFARASQATLHDTWHTSGLQGTASDDFELAGVFVPTSRTLDLFGPPRDQSPVWRLPNTLRFAMSKAAAACGIARGAMDALLPLLERVPFAGAQPSRNEPRVQVRLAQAEAAIEGGRAYLYQNVGAAWRTVQTGSALDLNAIANVRLAIVFAANNALDAVHIMQELGGTAAALDPALDRAARDIQVARHHLQLQTHVFEDVGRVLLGQVPRNPMF